MSHCTKILVSFDFIGKKEELSSLAFAHRQRVVELSLFSREALSFLDALARGDGVGSGGKGDIVSWGCVGNYVSKDDFIGNLLPFFVEAWQRRLVSRRQNVICMFQTEQRPEIKAYEIGLHSDADTGTISKDDLVIQGGKIQFPVWDAFDRQVGCDKRQIDALPALDLAELDRKESDGSPPD